MTRRLKFLLHAPRKRRLMEKIAALPEHADVDDLIPLLVDVADEGLSYLYADVMYEGVFILPRPQPYVRSAFEDIRKSTRTALANLAYIMREQPSYTVVIKNMTLTNREKYPPRS